MRVQQHEALAAVIVQKCSGPHNPTYEATIEADRGGGRLVTREKSECVRVPWCKECVKNTAFRCERCEPSRCNRVFGMFVV